MADPVDELDMFLAGFSPEVTTLALSARALILEVMPDALEQVDPAANLIGYGLDRSYKGLICGILLYKNYINLIFARGASLPDPGNLLTGTGKRARHIKITRPADLDAPGVRALLQAASDSHRG